MPWTANNLSETELAYMAGIIDGEGSICIFPYYGSYYKGTKYLRYKPALCVANTSEELIAWIALRFGGKCQVVKRRSPKYKQCFHWLVSHRHAAEIIHLILPFLVIKRRQAELFIAFQRTATRGLPGAKSADVIKLRQDISLEMKSLNRRGPPDAVAS